MTVLQLMDALKHCPPDAPVYIPGQIGYVITDDLCPMWVDGELEKIIMIGDASPDGSQLTEKFFVLITSPY